MAVYLHTFHVLPWQKATEDCSCREKTPVHANLDLFLNQIPLCHAIRSLAHLLHQLLLITPCSCWLRLQIVLLDKEASKIVVVEIEIELVVE